MTARRYELDWLRVIVFGLLIIYHVSMYFNPWGWHIKNTETYDWMQIPLLAVNQWRLEILFVISGMGTYFSLRKRTKWQYYKERNWRLGLPLLAGMLIFVPPQVYIERIVNEGLNISYWEYLSTIAFQGTYPEGNITWNHLWFLPYLLCYSVLLIPMLWLLPGKNFQALMKGLGAKLRRSPWMLYLFLLPVILVEAILAPYFPVELNLIGDWYAFSHYFLFFLFGFGFMHFSKDFFKLCFDLRKKALLVAVIAFGLQVICYTLLPYTKLVEALASILEIVYMWSVIIAIFGYAVQYLSKGSKYLSYLNEAVYPLYIFHQTILMIAIYQFRSVFSSDLIFFCFLVLVTFLGSWLSFEIIRRINVLRPLIGLKGKFKRQNRRQPEAYLASGSSIA